MFIVENNIFSEKIKQQKDCKPYVDRTENIFRLL